MAEEQEAKLRGAVCAEADNCYDHTCPCWDSQNRNDCRTFNAALDRLRDFYRMQAQAEMPCYDGDAEQGWDAERGFYVGPTACPSCKARLAQAEGA
jgi:hypothetical protein